MSDYTRRIASGIDVVRRLGVPWLAFRLRYALKQRVGSLERATPVGNWEDRPLATWLRHGVPVEPGRWLEWHVAHAPRFPCVVLPSPAAIGDGAISEAEDVLRGDWRLFSRHRRPLGFPPDWHLNALTQRRVEPTAHWSRIGEGAAGDVKWIWELSRFGSAFALGRAYAKTGDDRFAEGFWRLVEDWCLRNPPNQGANWGCGQEASFRVMAWLFGWRACAASAATTPPRAARVAAALAWHAERIARNVDYAISQRNNHGISEGVGLFTVGVALPELEGAERWRALGRRVIEAEVHRQVFADGAYVQHSMNYHRVMLHDMAWALRLGDVAGAPLADDVRSHVARAADWLAPFVDPSSGQVPNHGANDGALVLPLSDAEFGDFRPVVQLARAVASGCRTYDPGPWDEPLAWLGIEGGALRRVPPRTPAPSSGYFLLGGEQSRALVRCARYDSRPSHADQLHVDLWIDGDNVACDAGTYLYTAAPPWDNALARTAVHNTVTVDGRDQMTRVGRFLWAHWAQGRVAEFDAGPRSACFAGEHDGYRALGVAHRRAVWNCGRTWFVVDDVVGLGRHRCRLHWLLPDGAEDGLQEPDGAVRLEVGGVLLRVTSSRPFEWSLVRGGSAEEPTRGWRSRHYGDLERSRSLAVVIDLPLPVRFVTSFAPAAEIVEIDTARVRAGNTVVELAGIGDVPIRRRSVGAREAAAERPRASSR